MTKLVLVESPYAGDVEANLDFARRCVRDCLLRGESPIASHLLYTQPGILDDNVPEERAHGIEAGLAWLRVADATVVYYDRGISNGMRLGIERAHQHNKPVYLRRLGVKWKDWLVERWYLPSLTEQHELVFKLDPTRPRDAPIKNEFVSRLKLPT